MQFPDDVQWVKVFRSAVKFSPIVNDTRNNEIRCKRPQSFNWISHVSEIKGGNSGQTGQRGKYYFFDRAHEVKNSPAANKEMGFPTVKLLERTVQYDDVFTQNDGIYISNMKVFILDNLSWKNCDAGYCNHRGQKELLTDCNAIWQKIMTFINKLEYYEADNEWSTADVKGVSGEVSVALKNYLRKYNKDILGRVIRAEGEGDLMGYMFDFNAPSSVCIDTEVHVEVEYGEPLEGDC